MIRSSISSPHLFVFVCASPHKGECALKSPARSIPKLFLSAYFNISVNQLGMFVNLGGMYKLTRSTSLLLIFPSAAILFGEVKEAIWVK